MRPASETHATYLARPSWRSRLTSLAFTLAIVALILLALLKMGAMPFRMPGDGRALSTFDVAPPGPKAERAEKQAERQQSAPKKAAPPRTTPPPPPVPPPPIELPGVIKLSRQDFNASNIANIPRADPGEGKQLASGGGGGDGRGPATGGGGGGGPNGETLYNAEWVREPTRAEMVTYLPQRAQAGWGMIACRTVERNRVEDCVELGETPGSGIARGMRRAAWQFLVRPPRVNGKPQVGAWVRIKYDITVTAEK